MALNYLKIKAFKIFIVENYILIKKLFLSRNLLKTVSRLKLYSYLTKRYSFKVHFK